MRTKFYYLALAALVFCWQVIYIVLPLPHGEEPYFLKLLFSLRP